jgi:hypothetical protein
VTVALGPGRVGLAAGQDQFQVVRILLPTEAAQRQQAGHRGNGQQAVVRALRDAQDVASLHGHTHAEQNTQDKTLQVRENVACVTDHNQSSVAEIWCREENWGGHFASLLFSTRAKFGVAAIFNARNLVRREFNGWKKWRSTRVFGFQSRD